MAQEKQRSYNEDRDYRNEMSKLTIEINRGLKRRIIMAAGQSDLSISEYISYILEQTVLDEESIMQQELHPVTPEILEQILQARQKIMEETNGRIFEDSVEVIRQMREERSQHLERLLRGDME